MVQYVKKTILIHMIIGFLNIKTFIAYGIESNLYLPSTKAIWYLGIIFPNSGFNLLANTFAKILYLQLTKLIGWKYLILLNSQILRH